MAHSRAETGRFSQLSTEQHTCLHLSGRAWRSEVSLARVHASVAKATSHLNPTQSNLRGPVSLSGNGFPNDLRIVVRVMASFPVQVTRDIDGDGLRLRRPICRINVENDVQGQTSTHTISRPDTNPPDNYHNARIPRDIARKSGSLRPYRTKMKRKGVRSNVKSA